jgi:hypothetical protein
LSLPRFKAKRDASEPAIVKALEGMGVFVWRLDLPVDLLLIFRGRVLLAEVKTPGPNAKRMQANQEKIMNLTTVHILRSPDDAINLVQWLSREAA